MRRFFLVLAVVLFSVYIFTWYAFPQNNTHDELSVFVLDVGQGDAIYIRAPDGSDMLIDGGPRGSLRSTLEEVLPFGDRTIDVVVITNPDTDHYAGLLDIIKEYTIGIVLESGTYSDTKTYAEFSALVEEKKIPQLIAQEGMRIVLDESKNVSFSVLFPGQNVSDFSTNDGSIIGKLSYGNRSFLFTGDATTYTETLLLRGENSIDADVLKVGHHGSRTSTSEALLREVTPTYAIISAGVNNRYGHPHKEVLERLSRFGIQVFGTYQDGTVHCRTNGEVLSCSGISKR